MMKKLFSILLFFLILAVYSHLAYGLIFVRGPDQTVSVNNVEDVFSTYLYTGNGSTQTITNGINLSGQGGMVWIKDRTLTAGHYLSDTIRGLEGGFLKSETTAAQSGSANPVTAYSSTGFSLAESLAVNTNNSTYASWTFREAAKFFDVVTYTGNSSNRTIAHSLGIAPGMIIIKRTNAVTDWKVYHRSLTSNAYYLVLNTTAAEVSDATMWNSTTADATTFSLGEHNDVNLNAATYVAYLFAHDTGTDGIIQAGSWDAISSTRLVTSLGWEPQFLLYKEIDAAGDWMIVDNMRKFLANDGSGASGSLNLRPNTSGAETSQAQVDIQSATGFGSNLNQGPTGKYIYLAIRRGPMAQPTVGTQVLSVNLITGSATSPKTVDFGFPFDLFLATRCSGGGTEKAWQDRLRGANKDLQSNGTQAEGGLGISCFGTQANQNESWPWTAVGTNNGIFYSGSGSETFMWHAFRRYPGVFDVVCYTGTGSADLVPHSLQAIPELMIIKERGTTSDWYVVTKRDATTYYQGLGLNVTTAAWNEYPDIGQFTTTTFNVGQFRRPAGSSEDASPTVLNSTYTAYLFATKAGISKVGTYTGNGTNQTINCGFSAGARFVLIKATSTTGNWIVGDSARGLVAGNDPYLLLNTAGSEVTNEDWLDPDNSGFVVNETTAAANTNGVTYIYLAFS